VTLPRAHALAIVLAAGLSTVDVSAQAQVVGDGGNEHERAAATMSAPAAAPRAPAQVASAAATPSAAQTPVAPSATNQGDSGVTQETTLGPLKTLGVATAGVGLVGLVLGAVFGFEAMNKKQSAGCDVNSVCPNQTALDTLSKAQTDGNLSTTVFGIGGMLVASGIALWVIAPGGGVQVAPSAGTNAGGLLVRGSW
jgi:hypothetical protein